jgi:hypothetical protein
LPAALVFAFISAAHTAGLRPIESRGIDLGELSGVAHYTIERDGFRVVATLTGGEVGTPARVEVVLASGQSVVLSTPRVWGVAPKTVEIGRRGDRC